MRYLTIVGPMLALLLQGIILAAEEAGLDELRKIIASSNDAVEVGRAYDRCLGQLSRAELLAARADTNDSIALNAAWELRPRGEHCDNVLEESMRFVGFVEGRLRINLTDLWRFRLAYSYAYDTGEKRAAIGRQITDQDAAELQPLQPCLQKDLDAAIWRAPGYLIKRQRNQLDVEVPGRTLLVDDPRGVLDVSRSHRCKALLTKSHLYLAFFGSGDRFPLACVDLASRKIVWHAHVWAMGTESLMPYTSSGTHDLDLVVRGDQVFVLGSGIGYNCYLEAFNASTGASELRFATHHWFSKAKLMRDFRHKPSQ